MTEPFGLIRTFICRKNRSVENLEVGSTQRVKLESGTYDATISSILPEIDSATRTQTVVLRLDRAAISRVNPGQTVRWDATEQISSPGYLLPPESLTQGIRGLWTCYVLVPKEDATEPGVYQIQQQSVEIVHQESDRVLVRGTLQPGDRIVASGIHRLVPGQDVRIRNSEVGIFNVCILFPCLLCLQSPKTA